MGRQQKAKSEAEAAALEARVEAIAIDARAASRVLAELPGETRNAWLECAGKRLEEARASILEANARDVEAAQAKDIALPLLQRLEISETKWRDMQDGLRQVAKLPDPVGELEDARVLENGLQVARMRIPIGVIAIVYESRPNVTVDAAALCVKAGNAVILRGGSEAFRTNQALGAVLQGAAEETGIPPAAVSMAPSASRAVVDHLLTQDRHIDLVIPRGGNELVRKVKQQSTIPVIAHDAGVCHIYLDETAERSIALPVVRDSKIGQVAVCNALETLLCHEAVAESLLPELLGMLHGEGVEIRGCERTRKVFPAARPADESDWHAEYLDKTLAVRVVQGMDAAIEHVRRYGSEHTDVIISEDEARGREWLRRVDSSTVGVNCSTAFADGYRLGLGAEIGISTSKIHSFGPMGLQELTTRKFVLRGEGQLGR